MTELPTGLARWARLPGPTVLLDAVRLRARKGHATETGRLTALRLTVAQRREVGRLLGSKWQVSGAPVRLQDFAARLVEHGLTVRELAEAIGGRIEEDRVLRAAANATAATETALAVDELTRVGVPERRAHEWLTDLALPRPGSGELLSTINKVAAVWEQLPHDGTPVRLAWLATRQLGDAHALDSDQLIGRLTARLAATAYGVEKPQRSGHTWRRAWLAAGVLCDEVSSRVLVLNLPLTGTAHAVRVCRASAGDPVWLTLRSLNGDWQFESAQTVFVCENPTVVEAAADALGVRCPPLICTDGTATSAALELVAGTASAGIGPRIRADFDAAGAVIVKQLLTVVPTARLWRFDARSYRTLASPGIVRPEILPGAERPVANDLAELTQVRSELGVVIHEEALLDDLLADLWTASAPE